MKSVLLAFVVLTFTDPSVPTACPPPPPLVVQQADGSYVRHFSTQINSVACYSPAGIHRERWTARPEDGGRFICYETAPVTSPFEDLCGAMPRYGVKQ